MNWIYWITAILFSFGGGLTFTILMHYFDKKYMKKWRKGTVYE